MILLIIGSVLLLFGIFVFFKKNEGETEISLLGAKVKSNNSAILLITLGAIIAVFGGTNYNGNPEVKGVAKETDSTQKEQLQKSEPGKEDGPLPVLDDDARQQAMLAGSWELAQSLAGEKALVKIYGSTTAVPQGISDAMVVADNRVDFLKNGDFDFEGDLLLQFKDADNMAIDMKMRVTYNGKWSVVDNKLQQSIQDGSVVPTNETSRLAFAGHPVTLADFGYAPGTTHTMRIVSLNETSVTVKDPKTGENSTWVKKR